MKAGEVKAKELRTRLFKEEDILTLPKLYRDNWRKWGKQVAMRQKDYGIWNEYTWNSCYEKARYFCLGIISMGLEPGDIVCFIGDNEPEMYWAMFGIWAARGIVVGCWTTSLPHEIKFILDHSEAKFMIARDQEQVDKMLSLKEELRHVKKVIWWEPKGMRDYTDPWLMSFDEVVELGREYEPGHSALFDDSIDQAKPDEVFMMAYTSGTTGLPKGLERTHKSILAALRQVISLFPVSNGDNTIPYLPPAWFAEPIVGSGIHMTTGMALNFIESPDTIAIDMREIAPSWMLFIPREWESIGSTIQVRVNDAGFLKRTTFNLFQPVGFRIADLDTEQKTPNLFWRTLNAMARGVAFRPVLDKVGLWGARWGVTAGYTMGERTFRFWKAIGIDMRQVFGASEQGLISGHMQGDIRTNSVGTLLEEAAVRIDDSGELLINSPAMFTKYHKNPKLTKEAFEGCWFHTGDACSLDDGGHLYFMDRASELGELRSGLKFSPQYIEAQLRFGAYISDAMAVGDKEKDYVSAIINIDFDSVGKWAERNHIPYTTLVDLSQKEEVSELVVKDVVRINRILPEHARIKKFAVFHKAFDPDEAELTRSMKLRRGFMGQKYTDLVESIYAGKWELLVEAPVTYRDGRKGMTSAALKIRSVEGK